MYNFSFILFLFFFLILVYFFFVFHAAGFSLLLIFIHIVAIVSEIIFIFKNSSVFYFIPYSTRILLFENNSVDFKTKGFP